MDFPHQPFYREPTPAMDTYVIAEVQSFTDVVVEVTLPEYGQHTAIIPTSEIKVKRGRRVGDYVKKGKEVVAQVIRVDEEGRLDLSMKVVQEVDTKTAFEKYFRAKKAHSILCQGCGYNADAIKAMYENLHQMIYDSPYADIYAYFESCLVDESAPPNQEILKAIQQRMQIPSYTGEKEILIRNLTADDTMKQLNGLVEKGFKVFVTAPPKYKISFTAPSQEKLALALASV